MGHVGVKKAGGERVVKERKGFRYRARSRPGPGDTTVRGQFWISCGLRKWGWLRKGGHY